MIPDAIRRIAREGVEYPARAIVRSSRADSRYTATVEILDGAGEPTEQTLADVPLDPLWLAEDGSGVWAPPAQGQIVALTWMGGEAGHPVITSGALMQAAAPRVPVEAGEHSIQGETFDQRMKADEWRVSDEAGTALSGKGRRWLIASPDDDLLAALVGLAEAIRDATTIPDTAGGTPLTLNPTTQAAINAALNRVRAVLRS